MLHKGTEYTIKFGEITLKLISLMNRAYLMIGSDRAYTLSLTTSEDARALASWATVVADQLNREEQARRLAAQPVVMHSAVGEDAIRMFCILKDLDPDQCVVGIKPDGSPENMRRVTAMQYDLARLSRAADPCPAR